MSCRNRLGLYRTGTGLSAAATQAAVVELSCMGMEADSKAIAKGFFSL